MEIERGDRILPGCGLHQLRRGKDALANELVCRADADAEAHRGRVRADRDCEYFGKMPLGKALFTILPQCLARKLA